MRLMVSLLAATLLLGSSAARVKDDVAGFYRGRQIELQIGFPPGSGYDLAGRLIAPFFSKYLPGHPSVVVQNVEGASSLTLADQLYNSAPRDGSVLGLVSNDMPTAPFLTPQAAHFDVTKFIWIGTVAPETDVVIVTRAAPVKTLQDLFTKQLIVGASGIGGAIYEMPLVMNALAGMKFKIVSGYVGSAQIELAMQRGEVQGIAGLAWSSVKKQDMTQIRDGRLRIIAQYGLKKNVDLPDTPLFNLPRNETDRQALLLMFARQEYGRPLLLPPGVPAGRVAAIRQAFQSATKDRDFVSRADKAGMDVDPVSGEVLDALTRTIMKTNARAVARLRRVLDPSHTNGQ